MIHYVNDALSLTKTISFQNDSYPVDVTWQASAVKGAVSNVVLYVTVFFDLRFPFLQAYVPGFLNWANPWDKPTTVSGSDWATVDFSRSTLTDRYIGVYDAEDGISFALKFNQMPDWGNLGALASRQIDAIRFNCTLGTVNTGTSGSVSYQTLAFSKSSNPDVQMPTDLKSLFEAKAPAPFEVKSRDYEDYIRENHIMFIVYDKNELDPKMVHSKLLELIYSNDRYVIFKIKGSS